jgi:hypothetical protein
MAYPPVCPHGPIKQIGDDLFAVHGSIRMKTVLRISRNMAIVRNGSELTLVNPVRLDEQGLKSLDALGTVKHLLRLGGAHGADDPFYMERYKPTFWAQTGEIGYQKPHIDKPLVDGGELPFVGARLFCFNGSRIQESVVVIERGSGVLLTCDSLQHYGDYSQHNILARLMMPFIGFPRRTVVGLFWLKFATPEGASLQPEFDRLLRFKFDALLAAHGTCLSNGAHASVQRAVDEAFARSPGKR